LKRKQKIQLKKKHKRIRWSAKFLLYFFSGFRLYNKTNQFINSWVLWLSSSEERIKPWPKTETINFIAAIINRLLMIGLLGFCIAILPSILCLIQTNVLKRQSLYLEQQNQQFERQNNFIAYEHTSRFRDMLFEVPFDSTGNRIEDYKSNKFQADILLPNPNIDRWPAPDKTTISQIVDLAEKEREIVSNALKPLLYDQASVVSSGALLALYQISTKQNKQLDATGAQLRKADLSGAYKMITITDVQKFKWTRLNLSGIVLTNSDLLGVSLGMADLKHANLTNANLIDSDLRGAILQNAELKNALMTNINLMRANLEFANLENAQLQGADLRYSSLRGANFKNASLIDCKLEGATYHLAINLSDEQLKETADIR